MADPDDTLETPSAPISSYFHNRVQELVGKMTCRLCDKPCVNGMVAKDPDGVFDIFPGWCARHTSDMNRPLVSIVEHQP